MTVLLHHIRSVIGGLIYDEAPAGAQRPNRVPTRAVVDGQNPAVRANCNDQDHAKCDHDDARIKSELSLIRCPSTHRDARTSPRPLFLRQDSRRFTTPRSGWKSWRRSSDQTIKSPILPTTASGTPNS